MTFFVQAAKSTFLKAHATWINMLATSFAFLATVVAYRRRSHSEEPMYATSAGSLGPMPHVDDVKFEVPTFLKAQGTGTGVLLCTILHPFQQP